MICDELEWNDVKWDYYLLQPDYNDITHTSIFVGAEQVNTRVAFFSF